MIRNILPMKTAWVFIDTYLIQEGKEMSVDSVLDYGYKISCNFCVVVRKTLLSAFIALIAFGESAGRARAASELARMGHMNEAKYLMTGIKEND